jgi:ATP-dependent Lon protease
VGGIREKVLAAHRIGIKRLLLPRRNEPDVEDVPEDVRRDLEFAFVDTAEEVLAQALVPPAAGTHDARRRPASAA